MREIWHGKMWGDWKLDFERLVLTYERDRHWYEIDLERTRTSAMMLDWIFQVQQKGWATAETMNDLLLAFRDILNPQATLCSGGCSKSLNTAAYLNKRRDQATQKVLESVD